MAFVSINYFGYDFVSDNIFLEKLVMPTSDNCSKACIESINPEPICFGKSTCEGSPFTTILEFLPHLVRNILI